MIKSLLHGIVDLIYPPHCLICNHFIPEDSLNKEVCVLCIKKLKPNYPPFCIKCSRHMKAPIKHSQCKTCRQTKPHFDFAWCACHYTEEMKLLLHLYKYHSKTQLRHLFNDLIAQFIDQYNLDIEQFDHIMPIPLFPARYRERGFNQSALLAKEIAYTFQLPAISQSLIRIKNTTPQASLRQKERWTNTQGAFRIKSPKNITNKHVLLIDDLLTTSSTASQAALTLKNAGAARVGILTLAIA